MQDKYSDRIRIIQFVIVFCSIVFGLKLFYLQIIDRKNRERSNSNAIKELIEYPSRGQIFDRNNTLIVQNENLYDIMVTPNEVSDSLNIDQFCSYVGVSRKFYEEQFAKAKKTSKYRPYALVKQVPLENYMMFQEHIYEFKGFYAQSRTIRNYPYSAGALVLGDIGEIDSIQIKKFTDYNYLSGEYIGKNGIELNYEKYLRGQRGIRTVMVDALNRIKGSYANGELDKKPVAGDDIMSTLDIELQILGEELLSQKSGSLVAIEPSTGEVLALVSSPSYDPNILTGRKRNENYPKLLLNKYKPLYNRAIQGLYPPGSTFKALVALNALQMGAISESFGYNCPGFYPIGNKSVKCSHRHPPAGDVIQALTHSCNPYFCQTFRNSIDVPNSRRVQPDYAKWYSNMVRFGLNKKLNLDIKNEKKGFIPDTSFYNKMYRSQWKPTSVISLGIGQGEILLTPLQMANSYCVIANRGYYITPHLVKRITKNNKLVDNVDIKKISVPILPKFYETVINGLENVVNNGTARSSKIDGITLCGKTGTAQNPHGDEHSIFVGFAPKYNPKIVVACVIENGGGGGGTAAPIVSLIIEKYLKDSITAPNRIQLMNNLKNRHFINFSIHEKDSIH
jgi:penicillin-binding protein 2